MRPSNLLKYLAAPGTGEKLEFLPASIAHGEPYHGALFDQSQKCVGLLEKFKFDFLDIEKMSNVRKSNYCGKPKKALEQHRSVVKPTDQRIQVAGDEITIGESLRGLNGMADNGSIAFESAAKSIAIQFHAHGWSGIAEISLNGQVFRTVDLFNLETAIPKIVTIEPDAVGISKLLIRSVSKNIASMGRQVLIERIFESDGSLIEPIYEGDLDVNAGGEFKPKFFEILKALPQNAIVLDVGGGKRGVPDPRYVNLEYSRYTEPHVFGDATSLPFQTDSVDFIYTAAVLEHIADPLKAGRELYRVLKPGGVILANSAFMQPVHSEGQHFFNATPYGIREIFRSFPAGSVTWEGSFSDLVSWLSTVSGIRSGASAADYDDFMSKAKNFDSLVKYDKLMYIATGVWFEARKPT